MKGNKEVNDTQFKNLQIKPRYEFLWLLMMSCLMAIVMSNWFAVKIIKVSDI